MKINIDDKQMIENHFKTIYKEDYKLYLDAMEFYEEHYIFLDDNPILVLGNPYIIDLNDKDIYYKDGCMMCGNGKDNNRKWRELKHNKESYIMTYDEMLKTFGLDAANYLFYFGEVPEWW